MVLRRRLPFRVVATRRASSIRQWRRRFGPPCTTRCPTAAGWASLQICQKRPNAYDRPPWLPKFAASETNDLSFASFAQNLPWRSPINSVSPEEEASERKLDQAKSELERRRPAVQSKY